MTQLVINGQRLTILQVLYEDPSSRDAALTESRSQGAIIEENATVHSINGRETRCHLVVFPLEEQTVQIIEPDMGAYTKTPSIPIAEEK